MSRSFGLLLAVTAATAGCLGTGSFKPQSPDPVVWVDSDRHDWGSVEPTAPVEHVFAVKNLGGAGLNIARVQTSCGCTAAVMDHQFLKPGEETRLKVTFDQRGRHGTQTRTVWIHSNDPKTPQKQIVIQATIAEPATPPGGFPQVTAQEAPGATTMAASAISGTLAAPVAGSATVSPAPQPSATPAAPAPTPTPKPKPKPAATH